MAVEIDLTGMAPRSSTRCEVLERRCVTLKAELDEQLARQEGLNEGIAKVNRSDTSAPRVRVAGLLGQMAR